MCYVIELGIILYLRYGENAKVLHFIGPKKPWQYSYDTSLGDVIVSDEINHASNFLQLWWKIFVEKVQPELDCAFEVSSSLCVSHNLEV